MADVYILYSKKIDRFYIGSCLDLSTRYQQHLDKTYDTGFTSKATDWIIYFKIESLDYMQARNIEKHVKSMKSRKYIENLNRYPEITKKLISKFSPK